jgi:hypothetical protein
MKPVFTGHVDSFDRRKRMLRLIALAGACAALVAATVSFVTPDRSAEGTITIIVDATPATATNVVNTDHTITATVTDAAIPQAGVTVFFDVTAGPNAGDNGSGVTDTNGAATFTYNGNSGVGQDTIEACVFSLQPPARALGGTPIACDTVTKDWIDPTPTPSPTPSPTPTLAAGTATPSPSPTIAPVSLPGTGGRATAASAHPAAAVALLALLIVTCAAGSFVLKRVN